MYRTYENPIKLEDQLIHLKKQSERMKARKDYDPESPEAIELQSDIEDLKERINFAYQDQYEEDY